MDPLQGRARDLGIRIGTGEAGALDAITDVPGVRVGHRTLVRGADGAPDAVRTGVTAIFPHEGEPWQEWVYAGTHILNGYGELIGINQVTEWGALMSPIVLTSSLQIGKAYDATVRWIAGRDRTGAGEVMPVVSECDDSWLSDVLSFPLSDDDVAAALSAPPPGPWPRGASAPAPAWRASTSRVGSAPRRGVCRPTPAGSPWGCWS